MTSRIWVILGATSIIAEYFAHEAAKAGHSLRLVGRNKEQLAIISRDIALRYKVSCDVVIADLSNPNDQLNTILNAENELDLFLAHSDFTGNSQLSPSTITQLINTNILSTVLIIDAYFKRTQNQHNLVYLSSVAAARGRAKNSLYGASKAAIELYLEGWQQTAPNNVAITIARLGFIDTKQTYGLKEVFYAASPHSCAKACWQAIRAKKRNIYYPWFWRAIMAVITTLPFFIYKKMKV